MFGGTRKTSFECSDCGKLWKSVNARQLHVLRVHTIKTTSSAGTNEVVIAMESSIASSSESCVAKRTRTARAGCVEAPGHKSSVSASSYVFASRRGFGSTIFDPPGSVWCEICRKPYRTTGTLATHRRKFHRTTDSSALNYTESHATHTSRLECRKPVNSTSKTTTWRTTHRRQSNETANEDRMLHLRQYCERRSQLRADYLREEHLSSLLVEEVFNDVTSKLTDFGQPIDRTPEERVGALHSIKEEEISYQTPDQEQAPLHAAEEEFEMKSLAKHFLTTGDFSLEEKTDLKKKINALGGVLVESSHLPVNLRCCVICKKIFRTEKFLGACASGMWVLLPTYVNDSYLLRTWKDEIDYEVTAETAGYMVHCNEERELVQIPAKWRLHRQSNENRGPFSGWVVTLLLHDRSKSDVYSRLLQLGGAAIVSREVVFHNTFCSKARPLTHAFFEGRAHFAENVFNRLTEAGVICCDSKYISEFLISRHKAIKYVITQSPSINPGCVSLLKKPQSLEQNCLKLADKCESKSRDESDSLTGEMHNSDQENKNQMREVVIREEGLMTRNCTVYLRRLSPNELPRAHSNFHQSRTTSPYQSASSSSISHMNESDNESYCSGESCVIVKRLAADDCMLSENMPIKKGKFQDVPTILKDERTTLETNFLPLTVVEASNCDTLNQCTKRQREKFLEESYASLIQRNDSKLEIAPTCLLASQLESSSPCSAKKIRISPRDLPDITSSETCSVSLLQSSGVVQGTSADEHVWESMSSEPLTSVVVELTATSSFKDEKKRCGARRNIFDTPQFSETLQSDNGDLPDLSGDLPDLSGDENDQLPLAVLHREPSIANSSAEGDVCPAYPRSSAAYVAGSLNQFNDVLNTDWKPSELQSSSSVIPILDPVNCCSTVVFNLGDPPELSVMPSPGTCWDDILPSSLSSSAGSSKMLVEDVQKKNENTTVAEEVQKQCENTVFQNEVLSHEVTSDTDCSLPRNDLLVTQTAHVTEAEEAKKQNEFRGVEDVSTEGVCRRRIVRAVSRNAQIPLRKVIRPISETVPRSDDVPLSKKLLPIPGDVLSMMQYTSTEPLHVMQLLSCCVSPDRYPSEEALRVVVAYLKKVKNNSEMIIAQRASDVLHHVLGLFAQNPASSSIMRNLFVKSLIPSMSKTSLSGSDLWNLLIDVFNELLNALPAASTHSQDASMLLLRYIHRGLEIDFELSAHSSANWRSCTSFGDRSKRQDRCLLAEWLWADYFSTTVNRPVSQLLRVLIQALCAEGHRFQTDLVEVAQSLIGMVANCCYKDVLDVKSNSNDVLLAISRLDSPMYSLCSALASQIGGSNALTATQIEAAVSSCTEDWLAFGVSRLLLNWQMTSSQGDTLGVKNESISFKTIVSTYLNIAEHSFAKLFTSKSSSAVKSRVPSTLKSPARNDLLPVRSAIRKNVNKKNGKGETALHIACKKNDLASVKILLSSADIDINCHDHAGWTPLHEACNKGHVCVVKELLAYRSPRTITFYFSPGKKSSNRIDLTASSYSGFTPLHDAIFNNHIEIAKLLVAHGGRRLLEIKNVDGKTPDDLASDEMKAALCGIEQCNELQTSAVATVKREEPWGDGEMNGESSPSPTCCQDSINRYLVLLFEILKRYLSLKLCADQRPLDDNDRNDVGSFIGDVEGLRNALQRLQGGSLSDTQRFCLDNLECLSDCTF